MGMPDGDKQIKPLLLALATLPGRVIPVWSCSGHAEFGKDRLYVVVAVDPTGVESMMRLFDTAARQDFATKERNDRHIQIDATRLTRWAVDFDNERVWAGLSLKVHFLCDSDRQDAYTDQTVRYLIQTIYDLYRNKECSRLLRSQKSSGSLLTRLRSRASTLAARLPFNSLTD